MPDFPIVDTHVHLWNPTHLRYSWLDETPLLNQRYGAEEFTSLTQPVEIEQIVFMEAGADAGQSVAEANWVTGLSLIHI